MLVVVVAAGRVVAAAILKKLLVSVADMIVDLGVVAVVAIAVAFVVQVYGTGPCASARPV